MATQNKFNVFTTDLASGVHDFTAAGHTVKALLTNTAPVATNTVIANITEISAGNGYTAGGVDIENDVTTATATASLTGVDKTITASGGSIGPFRYVVLYNSTATGSPLISWADAGQTTLNDGEDFTIDFPATILDIT